MYLGILSRFGDFCDENVIFGDFRGENLEILAYLGPMSINIFFSETADPNSQISCMNDPQVGYIKSYKNGSGWMIFGSVMES